MSSHAFSFPSYPPSRFRTDIHRCFPERGSVLCPKAKDFSNTLHSHTIHLGKKNQTTSQPETVMRMKSDDKYQLQI